MTRSAFTILTLGVILQMFSSSAIAFRGISIGGNLIPNGSKLGVLLQGHMGPISLFSEYFTKSGTTTINVGINLLLNKNSVSVTRAYGGFGLGVSRNSTHGKSKIQPMVNALAGHNLKLSNTIGLFLQTKYVYNLGASNSLSNLVNRNFILQSGFKFEL